MKATHHGSSTAQPSMIPVSQRAIAIIGDALIRYQINKSATARIRLTALADMAMALNVLSQRDAVVLARVLSSSRQELQAGGAL